MCISLYDCVHTDAPCAATSAGSQTSRRSCQSNKAVLQGIIRPAVPAKCTVCVRCRKTESVIQQIAVYLRVGCILARNDEELDTGKRQDQLLYRRLECKSI